MVIQLWRSFPRYDEGLKFSTWMYRVGMNVAISFLRSEKRRLRPTVALEGIDAALGLIWLSHRLADRETRSPAIKGFMDALAGHSLTRALSSLDSIVAFEAEPAARAVPR